MQSSTISTSTSLEDEDVIVVESFSGDNDEEIVEVEVMNGDANRERA